MSKQPKRDDGFSLRSNSELPLWKRILAWCQYIHWYGPDYYDTDNPHAYYAEERLLEHKGRYDPHRYFGFPPVTEKELQFVEENLGFSHPPLLRELYLHVANGGFGPGNGLTGVPGGFNYLVSRDPRYKTLYKEDAIKSYGEPFAQKAFPVLFSPQLFDLERYEQQHGFFKVICVAEREWPKHFLHLCTGNEEEAFYVHSISGRVYLAGNAWNSEKTPTGEKAFSLLHWQTNSLEEWLEQWLAGRMEKRYFDPQTQLSMSFQKNMSYPSKMDKLQYQKKSFGGDPFDPLLDV